MATKEQLQRAFKGMPVAHIKLAIISALEATTTIKGIVGVLFNAIMGLRNRM